jgi:DNA-binding CsgD family transcriptional regulator
MAARIPANPEPAPYVPPLELEVLRAFAAGETAAVTAIRLDYSSSYVVKLRRRARERLGESSTAGAHAAALRYGLLR